MHNEFTTQRRGVDQFFLVALGVDALKIDSIGDGC